MYPFEYSPLTYKVVNLLDGFPAWIIGNWIDTHSVETFLLEFDGYQNFQEWLADMSKNTETDMEVTVSEIVGSDVFVSVKLKG